MANARKLPIGIQDFASLRSDGYIYVDKTELIYSLVHNGKPYFLSRPRRFGKSLLVTTLEAYFRGNKKPFEGLAIAEMEGEWAERPVLKFSLAGGEFGRAGGLRRALNRTLAGFEREAGLPEGDCDDLPGRLEDALRGAAGKAGRRVAVLVDEYDTPLLRVMGTGQEEESRALFKGFFAKLKDCDAYLRFVLFTGVTKFSKVSIFSDLNHLQDISMDPEYAGLCGITQAELERDFAPEVDALAAANGMGRGECLAELKRMYDGYHFARNAPGVYNPFSLINAFKMREFGRYWFETGTPTFLVGRLEASGFNPRQLSDGSLYAAASDLRDYRPENPGVVPLLYQSGYLTLTGYDARLQRYALGYPNDEVKYGFTESLAPVYLHAAGNGAGVDVFAIDAALEAADPRTLVKVGAGFGSAERNITEWKAVFGA